MRIKTVSGATGSVTNITYTDITLSNIAKYGIVIEQDYENGSPTGTPTNGVPITDVTISNVKGSVAAKAVPVYILCASCSAWVSRVPCCCLYMTHSRAADIAIDVEIRGHHGWNGGTKCTGVPTGASC